MLDRPSFLRPIAHRGLHDSAKGRIENTAPAFAAAIAKGYGIECDLRRTKDDEALVFHDLELKRLIDGTGNLPGMTAAELKSFRYRGQDERILTFGEFLDLVGGRVPLLVEVKNEEWETPNRAFLDRIGDLARAYKGPIALMSFDPAVMAVLRLLAPKIPRGIVAGAYRPVGTDRWWREQLGPWQSFLLRHLLRSPEAAPSFYAYHVKSLPTCATATARRLLGRPLFTWTVRTPEDRAVAARHADAMIFEGFEA